MRGQERTTEENMGENRTLEGNREKRVKRREEERRIEDDGGEERMPTHRLFSRLLLKSLIMSERKRRLASISSALGLEFFNSVATTFRITTGTPNTDPHSLFTSHFLTTS